MRQPDLLATQSQLIGAGRQQLVDFLAEPLPERLGRLLSPAAIAKRAGYSGPSVLYKSFAPNASDLAEVGTSSIDLFLNSLLKDCSVQMARRFELDDDMLSFSHCGIAFETAVNVLAGREWINNTEPPEKSRSWPVYLGTLVLLRAIPSTWQNFQASESSAFDSLALFYKTALTLWQRKLVEPLTYRQFALIMGSVLDGMLTNGLAMPEDFAERLPLHSDLRVDGVTSMNLFQLTVQALVRQLTEQQTGSCELYDDLDRTCG